MQLVKCLASRPGLFNNTEFDFGDRATVIFGKNGSGKTIFAKSIVDSIWHSSPVLVNGDILKSMYFDIHVNSSAAVRYRFTNHGEKNYQVKKLFPDAETLIALKKYAVSDDREIELDQTPEGRELNYYLTRIDKSIFLNSSFVESPSDTGKYSRHDYSSLKKILLYDSSGYYEILLDMEGFMKSGNCLERELAASEMELKELSKSLELYDMQNSRTDKLYREKHSLRKEIDELKKSMAYLTRQKETQENVLANLERIEELNKNLLNIKGEVDKQNQILSSILSMKAEIDTMFPQFSGEKISDFSGLDELQNIFNQIRNINEKIDNWHFEKDDRKIKRRNMSIGVNLFAALSLLGLFIKNGFSLMNDLYAAISIVTFALLFSAGVILINSLSHNPRNLSKLMDERRELEARLQGIIESNSTGIREYRLSEIYEYLIKYFEDYIDYSEKTSELNQLKDSIKDMNDLAGIEEKLELLKNEEERIRGEISRGIESLDIKEESELSAERINSLITRIGSDMESVREKIKSKEDIVKTIDDEISRYTVDGFDRTSASAGIENLNRRIADISSDKKTIALIHDFLQSAVESREQKQLNRLSKSALLNFNFLTANQFVSIIDEAVLKKIIVENSLPEDINQSVKHLVFLSIKLALTEFLIDAGITLPLIIDEPFLFMDSERTSRFKQLIDDISSKRQVVIFTHHTDKGEWGKYIELQ